MADDSLVCPDAPAIPDLRFRRFQGSDDFPQMAAVIAASAAADQLERATTAADLADAFAHLTNSDPYQDAVFAEHNGQLIGYARGWWYAEDVTGVYIYGLEGFLVPEWRRNGIGRAMLRWIEQRLSTIAAQHPPERPKFFQLYVSQGETDLAALLERAGYHAARYSNQMIRPSLNDIPTVPMPPGLEVRPVEPSHYRLIWDAANEAFRDHWGVSLPTEDDYQAWLHDRTLFQPQLWQVAWDIKTNQVAGQIRTFIDHAQNKKYGRKRGYTEFISVRRPWRRQGLARALIVRSLHAQREQGMTESWLGVDAENRSGATYLYEACGFRVVKRSTFYRKPLPLSKIPTTDGEDHSKS